MNNMTSNVSADAANKLKKSETVPAAAKTTLHSPQSSVSFLVDLADIHSMKENLQDLLTSFRAGKLKAFGDRNSVEQMENIRQMQVIQSTIYFRLFISTRKCSKGSFIKDVRSQGVQCGQEGGGVL